MERRLLCKNHRFVSRIQRAASALHALEFDGRRGVEAAEKNEDYEGYEEED